METTKKLSLDDIFGKVSAPASSEAVKSIDDIFGQKEKVTPEAPYGTMTDEIRGVSHAPADLIGVSPQPAVIGENELQKNRAGFEKELKSTAGAIQPAQDSFKPMSADAFKVGGDVTMPGDIDKPKSLSQTVQSEINKRWGGDLQSIIDKARSVSPENIDLAEDMESHFWKVMKDKVPSDSFITQEDLDGFKFTHDYSNGDKDIEYSFGHYTYPQEVVNEYVARHNDEVLHNMRFKEEPEYRNEWFLRNVGVTEQAYRDEIANDLENRLQELRKKVVSTLPAQHTRGGYAAIGAAANKPSSLAPVSIEKIDKALKTVNTLRKNSFGAGLKEGFDSADILTLGVSGIGENVALLNALNKSASGKTLTTSEQALVEAWDIQNEAEEVIQVLGGRSLASNIGRGGAQSLGFITQTVGTGGLASAATKGITRAAAKSALKRVASTGVASKIQEGVRYGSLKAAESLVGAAARTPFMGFTYRNYTDKRLNQFQVNERFDEAIGEISKYIDKQESSALRDAAHAALESYFESQSEDVGGLIDFGITSFARALPIKQFIRSSVVNGMTGAVKNGAMKWIKESAKIYGLAGEVLSEAYGDAAVNLLTSNTDGWKQMASSEYWWELLGVSSMLSGGFGVVNRAVNSYSGRNLDRQIAHEDNNRRNALSRIEDDMLKKELTEVSLTDDLIERSKMLSSLDWSNFTKEDMANTIDFISAQTRLDVMRESDMESRRLARIMPAIDEVKTLADNGALDEDQAAASLAVIYGDLFRTQENQRALNILTDRIKVAADAGISADEINEILRGAGLTVFNPGDEIETLTGDRAIVDKVLPGAYEVVNNEGDRAVVSFEEVLQNTPEVRQIQQESNQTEGQTESVPENNPQVEQAVESARQEAEVIKNLDDDVIYEATLSDGAPVNIIKGANIVYNNQTGEVDYDASDATVVVRANDGSKRQISIREIDSIDQAMSVDEALEVATAAATEVVNSQEQVETATAEVASAQAEVPSAQEAESATVEQSSESPANQPEEQPQIPLLKNGEPDYNAMDADMFTEQYVSQFGEELTEKIARNNIKEADKAIASIQKQIDGITDPNKLPALYAKQQESEAKKDKYTTVIVNLGLSEDASEDNASRVQRMKKEATPRIAQLFPDGLPNVESVVMADIATGNKIRWTNKEVNGTIVSKGLGAELGLADSKAERTRRISMIGKDAPTPEEYAESLRERLDAMGVRYDESELRNQILNVYASVDTPKNAWEWLENMSANMQADQEGLDYEEEQMRRAYEQGISGRQRDVDFAQPEPEIPSQEEYNQIAQEFEQTEEVSPAVEEAQVDQQMNEAEGNESQPRKLTSEEADVIISAMEANAAPAPEIELTPKNWVAEFGEDGIIETPIGKVKMGENQYFKLAQKGRESKLGMIKPTLESPDVIVEEKSSAKGGQVAERNSSYVFVKAFTNADGTRTYKFTSVTIRKDGREVVISNQEKETPRIKRLLREGMLTYISEATLPSEPTHSTQGDQQTIPSGATLSDSKDTTSEPKSQEVAEKILQAEAETNIEPSEAQKEAGNYKKGHVSIDGLNITIENPKDTERSGVDENGQKWSVKMNNTYGYIRRTEGKDGDHIDLFLSDHIDDWNGNVFVVDQVKPDGSFDEHKVMYGFDTIEEAEQAYMSNYSIGWKGLGAITGTSKEEFKKWLDSSHRKTKPFAEYKAVKKTEGQSEVTERRNLANAYTKAETSTISQGSEQTTGQPNVQQEIRHLEEIKNYPGADKKAVQKEIDRLKASTTEEPQTIVREAFSIEPAQYTNKRGKILDMHLVKFADTLTKEQQRAAKELAKAEKGWYDREQGGFMMRSEESAKRLADIILNNDDAVSNAQPVSLTDMQSVTNGEVVFTETQQPKQATEGKNAPVWQYSISVDSDGFTTLRREDISGAVPVVDAFFTKHADEPQEMLDILRNPLNGMQEILDVVGTTLEDQIATRELNRKIEVERRRKYEELKQNGVNGFKIGDKVLYTPEGRSRKPIDATIHDFEEFGDNNPVLDVGLAPIMYEATEWKNISKDGRQAAEQGNSLSAYIKERKKENQSGFYKIRPKDEDVRFRVADTSFAHAEEVASNAQKIADKFGLSNEIVVAETQEVFVNELQSENVADELIKPDAIAVFTPFGRIMVNATMISEMAELPDSIMHEFAHNVTHNGDMPYRIQDTVLEVGEERFEAFGRELFGTNQDPWVVADDIIATFVGNAANPALYEGVDLISGVVSGQYTTDEAVGVLMGSLTNDIRDGYVDVIEAMMPYVKEVFDAIKTNHDEQGTRAGSSKEKRRVRISVQGYAGEQKKGNNRSYNESYIRHKEYQVHQAEEDSRGRRKAVKEAAELFSKQLNTPIRIVEDVNTITDNNTKLQERKRNAKGWFDNKANEVVVVLPNATSVEDVRETIFHEVVGHKGLQTLVGKERFNAFLDKVYANANEEVRRRIALRAAKLGWDFHEATEEYIAELAEQGFEERENRNFFEVVRDLFLDMLRRAKIALGYNISDNDLRYMLWRTYQMQRSKGAMAVAEDIVMQQKLGVGNFRARQVSEEEQIATDYSHQRLLSATSLEDAGANLQPDAGVDGEGGLQFRGGLLQSREGVTADAGGQMGGGTRADRADLAESNQIAKSDSRARLIAELRQKLRDVKAETRTVAAEVGKIVRKAITAELIDKMGKRTFDNIVRTIETATVRRDVEYAVNRIEEAVLDMELRDKQDKFDKYLNLRVQGESARGVSIAANVTDQVRQFITIIRDNLDRPASEVEALIEERGGSLAERTGLQVLGFYQDAHNFEREVQEIEDEIEKIKSENTELRKKRAALNKAGKTNDAKNLSDQINANKETIEHLNSERISTKRSQLYYIDMAANELEREIAYGKEGHKEWLQQEAERKQELIKIAWNDIRDGKKIPILDEQEPIWKKAKNTVVEFLLAPAYSWDYLLKMISVNAPNGEGALYDHFMRSENGYVAASGNYYQAYEDFKARLNEKAKDIFGKDYKQVLKDSNQPLDVTIQISAQGASEIYTPTIGEVVYAYMAAKMPDGRVKLDKMGVKEDIIDYLVRQIPQGYITFADWVQNEFLPERRKVYNKTHLEVFGTQMAQIENYVPLKVKKDFVYEEFDGSKIDKAELPSSITGSIIKRKRNSLPIDLHTNIFDLLLDHGQQMEHWNAYTRIVRDTNQFLSNTQIRRALDYRKKGLHRKLKEAALIASNRYQSDVGRLEKMTVALNKMAASSKIAFRINTAIKQVLSYPAFYAYVADAHFWGYLTRNISPDAWGRNFRWALDNIPSFQERWLGRMAGDDRLAQMTSPRLDRWIKGMVNVGMLPNALVDAVTCANGAQAVYRYEHERYLKIGLDKSEADRLAKISAALALNQTQQSSEGMYLSRIQADRTAFAVAISTFQNSNFAYLRKELEGIDQLMRDTKKQIANREKYYEQQGVNPDQAAKLALQDVVSANRTAVAKILVFGFILNTIWTLGNSVWKYAFGDEDEEDKWEDAAIRGFFNSFTRNLSVGQYVETFAWSDFRELNPSLLLSDLNMFIERLESIAEGNVKMWDRTAAWTVLSTLSSLGLGVDINSFASMCEGVQGAIDNGANVEDIMLLVNAPRSQAKFIAGPPKEGETLDEYIKRQAWIERKIVSRIDKKQLDKWSRNYEAYKQAEMLAVPYSRDKMGRVSVPYIKDIDDSYSALLKSVGRTKSGAKRNDGDSIADDAKTRIRDFGLIKRIKDINALEKNLDAMVILDGAYPERLKELCETKQQLIEEWNQ